jgi:hypothetical protein
MTPRTLLSWAILLAVIAVIGFFGYHILNVSAPISKEPFPAHTEVELAIKARHAEADTVERVMQPSTEELIRNAPAEDGTYEDGEAPAPVVARGPPIPNRTPRVPAQTEDDLRSSEPLQATPPSVEYDAPEAMDPMNRTAHMDSEFGSNFRHPEQMIERRPAMSMGGAVGAGIASASSRQGGNRSVSFAPEMAQNGGEFMQGIGAFDTTEVGTGFSMI